MRRALPLLLCGLWLSTPGAALADGGPAPILVGGNGATAVGSPFNYVALASGSSTVVERIRRGTGAVEGYAPIPGTFGVQGSSYDGTGTGLSANGRTLVLAALGPVYPPRRTRLVVLDASRLRVRERISLRGFFSVDAISPTGRWLYLIHYRSPGNILDYEVRAYDVGRRRLLAKPIVDPREPDEKMQGIPVTRTMSPDGRWAYTLYQRGDRPPFVHALDTARLRAFCVDLPLSARTDTLTVRLVLGEGGRLLVERGPTTVATMDTRTFAVRIVHSSGATRRRSPGAAGGRGGGAPWELAPALAVGFAAVAAVAAVASRRRSAGPARAAR